MDKFTPFFRSYIKINYFVKNFIIRWYSFFLNIILTLLIHQIQILSNFFKLLSCYYIELLNVLPWHGSQTMHVHIPATRTEFFMSVNYVGIQNICQVSSLYGKILINFKLLKY